MLRIVTSNVLARIRSDPDAKFYGVSQNDWLNHCECPACKAIDEEEGSPAGTVVRFSEHAQCLALLVDILPPGDRERAFAGLAGGNARHVHLERQKDRIAQRGRH